MALKSINPATLKEVASYEEMSQAEVRSALDKALKARASWKALSFDKRAEYLLCCAEELKRRKEKMAELMVAEIGKPITQALAEAEKCAWVIEYYAKEAAGMLQDRPVQTEASKSYIHFEPLGTLFAIMPWNFPFWQVFRAFAPTLMAGNTMVLKHASNVTGCALIIDEICKAADLPEGVFGNLLIGIPAIKGVIQDPAVSAVTLTGSTPAGKAVAQQAGEVLKKCVLELGGSDPYIILKDADLDLAAKECAASRMINSGQSCVAAKRFIVEKEVRKEFESLLCSHMESFIPGDPREASTNLGPLARVDLRDSLHEQVQKSVELGAKALLGGKIPDMEGAYYPATVLSDVKPGMPAYEEEFFGPVASVIEVNSEEEAVKVANATPFGLGGGVFSRDVEKAERIAALHIESGNCFVNTFVKSDPRLPFGGVKESGFGRELGIYGLHEFVNVKTVYIA